MNRIRAFLNNFIGRIRFLLATWRKRILDVCKLSLKHWRWAAIGVLLLPGLIAAGVLVEYAGILGPPVLLMAFFFYLGLPLLAGLGVHFAWSIVSG